MLYKFWDCRFVLPRSVCLSFLQFVFLSRKSTMWLDQVLIPTNISFFIRICFPLSYHFENQPSNQPNQPNQPTIASRIRNYISVTVHFIVCQCLFIDLEKRRRDKEIRRYSDGIGTDLLWTSYYCAISTITKENKKND